MVVVLSGGDSSERYLGYRDVSYLAAQANIYTQLAIGVGKGEIPSRAHVRMSNTINGVAASADVAFAAGMKASYDVRNGGERLAASGDLHQSTADREPSTFGAFTRRRAAGSPTVSRERLAASGGLHQSTADREPSTPGASAGRAAVRRNGRRVPPKVSTSAVTFRAGNNQGGRIEIDGDGVTYVDKDGKMVGRHKFGGLNVPRDVVDAPVPPPSRRIVAADCSRNPGGTSENVTIITMSESFMDSSGRRSYYSLLIAKHAAVDCRTRRRASEVRVNFSGADSGKEFAAVSNQPTDTNETGAGDDQRWAANEQVAQEIPATEYAINPGDEDLLIADSQVNASSSTSGTVPSSTVTTLPPTVPSTLSDGVCPNIGAPCDPAVPPEDPDCVCHSPSG
jgi:hypothetical protein